MKKTKMSVLAGGIFSIIASTYVYNNTYIYYSYSCYSEGGIAPRQIPVDDRFILFNMTAPMPVTDLVITTRPFQKGVSIGLDYSIFDQPYYYYFETAPIIWKVGNDLTLSQDGSTITFTSVENIGHGLYNMTGTIYSSSYPDINKIQGIKYTESACSLTKTSLHDEITSFYINI